MRTRTRSLRPEERVAFQRLQDWLDGVRPEIDDGTRRRLRVFFQDNPIGDIRVEEEVEAVN